MISPVLISKEFLIEEYINKNKTRKQIASDLGVKPRTVKTYVLKYKLPKKKTGPKNGTKFTSLHKERIRLANTGVPKSKEHKIKLSKICGNKHWRFGKGTGRTGFNFQIRNCFKYNNWRQQVFIRDGFKCKKCGATGLFLNAHHIKHFKKLVEEAIYYLPLLSKYDACIFYDPLWDLDNGLTVCPKCHKQLHK